MDLNYPKTLMLNTLLEGHGSFTRWNLAEDVWVTSLVPLNEIMELFLFSFSLWLPAMREHLFDWVLLNITGACCKPKSMGTSNRE